MTMEISNSTNPRRLELALKESKETTLNGHVVDDHESKSNGCISVSDIKLKVNEICQLCGKMWIPQSEKEEQSKSNGIVKHDTICKECMTPAETVCDPRKVVDSENKRDSGFHTLKRYENEKPTFDTGQQNQNPDPVLSNASSADSAVSMGACVAVDETVNVTMENVTPNIVVDECDMAGSPAHGNFDSSDGVFRDEEKDAYPKKELTKSLAEKLFKFDGYKRTEIARILGKNSEYHRQVAKCYLQYFNFAETALVEAYRQFLSHFALLGETQERERILLYFSERYLECNPVFLDCNIDSVHTLVCAITLLNTDLHGNVGLSSGRKKMTYKQFSLNLSGLMSNNEDYPKDLLASLYNSVKKHPLPWGGKEPKKVPRSMSMRHGAETDSHRSPGKMVNRSLSTRSPLKPTKTSTEAPEAGLGRSTKTKSLSHGHGLLWRKLYMDLEGKKVSIGKRGWKVYTVTLQNLELHIVKKGTSEAKSVSVHHCLAEETASDSKRQHVFRVTHADSSVTLYQANSDKEARKWVRDINKAAALLSAAPLCSPVGSQLIFRRPLLPSAPSTLPPSNQLKKIHELLKEHEQDLSETQKMAETERSTSEQRQKYYQDKISYLKSEIRKYDSYVKILQMHMRTSSAYQEESNSNLETSDNGSLVSVTPSEPPLASPSAFDVSENPVFMDNITSADSVLSPPAHLSQSPQVRSLTLSPTSSLPNLSPILESPTKWGHVGNQPPGSLKRRRRRDLYESSLNGFAPPSPRNSNNSNQAESTPRSYQQGRLPVQNFPPKVGIETVVVGMKMLSSNQEPFPVKRYEMRIADMAPEYESPTTPPDNPTFESRTRLVGGSSISDSSATEAPLPSKVENATLSRVKGRNEKRGIDRYSYMQAVSPYGEV